MTDDNDFERASSYVNKIDDRIEKQYDGRGFDQLTKKEKVEAIKDIFYQGLGAYDRSAEKLTNGIQYVRGTGEFKEVHHKNGKITIRDSKGRIFRWIK